MEPYYQGARKHKSLTEHLREIAADECIFDDGDVAAVFEAANRIEALEAELVEVRRLGAPLIQAENELLRAKLERRQPT